MIAVSRLFDKEFVMNNVAQGEEPSPGFRLADTFKRQQQSSRANPYMSYRQRRRYLLQLAELLTNNQDSIAEAISLDFGCRPRQETQLLEIFNLVSGIHFTLKHLKQWMKPQKRHVGLAFWGAKNLVIPQPKGVIGVIAPWNYPLFLSLSPCTSALAAGNRCLIKLAAKSQRLAQLLDKLIQQAFDDDVLAVIPGVSATDFTSMPWDHLVFTGSPKTAESVMLAAAKNLTPLTLELGGKSPAIVAADFPVELAAERLLLGKFLNAGQTCVAPDYVFIARDQIDIWVETAKTILKKRYPDVNSVDYTSIVDAEAYERLSVTLADAVSKGARAINLLGSVRGDERSRKFPPYLILEAEDGMRIMQEEIFGPLMPVIPYDSMDEVINYINRHERPLALYLYSNDRNLQQRIIYNTLSGGMCINDNVFHVAQHDMPFGGIGNSGMGQYHGREGFNEFSKLRPVFHQTRFSRIPLLAPPYGHRFDTIFKLLLKLRR